MEGVAGENETREYVKLGDEIIPPKTILQIHRHFWIHEVRITSTEDCKIHL